MPSQTLSDAVVANANIGISNIIEEDVLIKEMIRTFTELAEKLKAHCGPYSGTAILTNPTQLYQEPIFTKDGINIVKSIQYVSPLQDFVRRQMAYIGSRVESNAGAGTTSSMIITAYTLAAMLETPRTDKNLLYRFLCVPFDETDPDLLTRQQVLDRNLLQLHVLDLLVAQDAVLDARLLRLLGHVDLAARADQDVLDLLVLAELFHP